jgi:hypothetical protein
MREIIYRELENGLFFNIYCFIIIASGFSYILNITNKYLLPLTLINLI